MINFGNIKQKALDAVTVLTDKATVVYGKAEEKTKEIAKTTQLNAEIVREKNNVKKLTLELGSLYYQMFKDAPEEALKELCAQIEAANQKIDALQAEVNEIKEAAAADVEVEIVTSDDECCCEDECECTEDACCCGEAEESCCCEEEKAEEACTCGCGCEEEPKAEESCCCGEEAKAEEPCDCGCGCDTSAEEEKKDDCGCGC